MTLTDMKKKVLSLIEELNPESAALTDDPDISAKLNGVINQVMFELARFKKIPKFIDQIAVKAGETLDFAALEELCGNPIYQIIKATGAKNELKANGTVIKFSEDGIAEIEVFVYPISIIDENAEAYIFELSPDALEIMPYGVAADLLKSDASASFGEPYSHRYETMLKRLDFGYNSDTVSVEGGIEV